MESWTRKNRDPVLWDRRGALKLTLAVLLGSTGIYAFLKNYRKNHVLEIVEYPDPALRSVSNPIERIDSDVVATARSMIDTLRYKATFEFFRRASLYRGLSAPQVGISKRLFVCGINGAIRTIVNPEIVERRGACENEEYCMSLPRHQRRTVRRSNYLRILYTGLDNRKIGLEATGSAAGLLEHEIDHLNGVLYIDYT